MNMLEELFVYDPKSPMIFSNPIFWVFFGLLILIYQGIYRQNTVRNLFLLVFSIFFYYKTGGLFLFLILFSTVVDFIIGKALHKSRHQATRTFLLVSSLVVNLGLLSYFKYTYFFTELFNATFQTAVETQDYLSLFANEWFGTQFDITEIILPVGISFYTFQTLSYTLDIYRKR